MSASNRLVVSIVAVAALAIAFWMLALSPKREEADELGSQVSQMQASLAEAQSQVAEATAARHAFPADYHQLVVLGQAVPASDETSSLLVELQHVATESKVKFNSIQLESSGEQSEAAAGSSVSTTTPESSASGTPNVAQASDTVPPTEAAASLLPLGAEIGPAGLAVMPYSLNFSGSFFHIADFMQRIDSLLHPSGSNVGVDGRLVTLNGFSLAANAERGFPYLDANFDVTTYLTPPSQGVTAGATPTAPAPSTSVPTSTSGGEGEASSETAAAR